MNVQVLYIKVMLNIKEQKSELIPSNCIYVSTVFIDITFSENEWRTFFSKEKVQKV